MKTPTPTPHSEGGEKKIDKSDWIPECKKPYYGEGDEFTRPCLRCGWEVTKFCLTCARDHHIQSAIQMPCLECKKPVWVKADGYEVQGVFNVFCRGGDCEDLYAAKL